MRARPFAVEQVRRQAEMSPAVRWRKLLHHGRQAAARALGEISGPEPDRGGSERWSLMDFAREASLADTPPFARQDADTTNCVALFRAAARAFAQASAGRRKTVAPALLAAAQVIEDLMAEERP